jgi:hypothetical protein
LIRLPKNIIISSQYTSGGEYFIKETNIPYKGPYFIVNGKAFTGREPDENSQSLEKISDRVKNTIGNSITNKLKSYVFDPSTIIADNDEVIRYFAKKLKEDPIKIIEIDRFTYISAQKDPGYATIEVKWNLVYNNAKSVNEAEIKFPGLKMFLDFE